LATKSGTPALRTIRRRVAARGTTFRSSGWATEAAIPFTARARGTLPTGPTHAASITHALGELAELGSVNEAICIAIGASEALIRLLA